MSPVEFLRTVWPDNGFYCIALPLTRGWQHVVCQTIDEAAEVAQRECRTRDVYFGIHTLKEEKVWDASKGEEGGWRVRTQANSSSAKCFFFDLDIGEAEHKYHSQAEALADLIRFCKEALLPKPLVTSSGGGLHVYWLLGTTIPTADWRVHALKLRHLAKHYGLKFDPMRTTDSASVLRVAGTFNLKDSDNPRPVEVLVQGAVTPTADFIKVLGDAVILGDVKVPAASIYSPVTSLLGSNLEATYDGPPVGVKALVAACPQMQRLIRLKGKFSEPEWYHGINLIRFVENGKALAHKLSEGHSTYSREGTDAKLAQLEAKDIKPTSCNKLAEVAGDGPCEGCSFAGRVKSPIVAARFKDEAPAPVLKELTGAATVTTELPEPPKPYARLKGGKIAMVAKNKDGDEIPQIIYDHDLYPLKRVVNAASELEQQVWRVVLPRRGAKDFTLDADALYDRRKFVAAISNQGVYPQAGNVPHLQDYMIAYIAELQKLQDADAQCNHLGWTDDFTKFILPDKIIQLDGTALPSTLGLGASRSSEHVRKKGSAARQAELMGFYDHPAYVANQFFILAGLAAPLFHMTGHHGVIINASGDAGASKSTSLYTAASLWGSPDMLPLNGTNNGATIRARNEWVTTMANLPVCVDEITHMKIPDVVDLAMSISQPGHRIRLGTDGVQRATGGGYKATIMLATANNSLHGMLSSDNTAGTAGSMRVVEIEFKSARVHKKHEADEYLHALKDNYGHMGEIFVAHVIQNQESISLRVRTMMKAIDIAANIQPSERYWSAAIATVLVACEIANELGICNYDVDVLRRWVLRHQIPYMRGVVGEEYTNPLGVVSDYLESINGNILVVSKADYSGNNLSNILRGPHGPLLAHYDRGDQTLWVLKKAFKDYCRRIGASSTKILDELNQPKIMADGKSGRIVASTDNRKVLGAGTEFAKAQSWCFVLNMAHPEVSGIADLAVVSNNQVKRTLSKADLKEVK